MNIYGTIMEINPFHNGHKYFLSQIPKSDSDILIVVLSTTIVQRGEISVLSKDIKTQLLLDNNVDIVVELPSVLANQGGQYFAKHAIEILKQFCITHLCFGSEHNNLDMLYKFLEKPQVYNFANGIYNEYLENLKSNDILGISYLKALKNTNIQPILVKRIENNYNDDIVENTKIQSATAIRNSIYKGEDVLDFLPIKAIDNIKFTDQQLLFNVFKVNLHNALDNNLQIFLAEENQLLNKILKVMHKNPVSSIEELATLCRDKNNSKYKFKRVIINTILLITDDKFHEIEYLHVLGFTKNGRKYCKALNNNLIITSLKNQKSKTALCELRTSKLAENVAGYKSNLDFQQPVIK